MTEPVHIGDATLYCGDCLDILPTLGKVDAVVTDPPYGIGLDYGAFKDDPACHYDWLKKHLFVIDCDVLIFTQTVNSLRVLGAEPWDHIVVWDKPMSFGFARRGWLPHWEPIYCFGSPANPLPDVLHHNPEKPDQHPCPKPVGLMVDLVRCTSGTILDPFAGSGTTGVACAKLGRRFIGIEIEPRYFDIACRRIEDAYRQPDLFIERPKPAEQMDLIGELYT